MRYVGDIETAGGNIRCNQDSRVAVLELRKRTLALRMTLIAMNGFRLDAARREGPRQLFDPVLSAAENDHFIELIMREQVVQNVNLVLIAAHAHHVLIDVFGRLAGLDGDANRVSQKLMDKLFDVA